MSENLFIHKINAFAKSSHNKKAIVSLGSEPVTFSQLNEYLIYVATTLRAAQIKRNDRVATVLPNGASMGALGLAISTCSTCAPLNPEYKASEFNFYLNDLNVKALITHSKMNTPAIAEAKKLGIPVLEVDPNGKHLTKKFISQSNDNPLKHSEIDWASDDDIALILHTSGTTALPKKVPLSHLNLQSSALNVSSTLQLTSEDTCLNLMPMFHIGGLVDLMYTPLSIGSKVVCTPNFSFPDFKKNIEEFSPSWCQIVPTMIQEIVTQDQENLSFLKNHSLRFIRSVSSALPESLKEQCEQIFSTPVIEVYGMSETAGQITSNPLPPSIRKPKSVGKADGTEIRIIDELGRSTQLNTTGEVIVRGPNVMSGYEYKEPPLTQDFIDGWLKTGDVGYLDEDNYLFLTGRIKEIINRGGEKLLPQEVDKIAERHPSVKQAITFPTPHHALGEEVAIAVVLNKNSSLAQHELINFLSQNLSYYKVPKKVYFVESIPATSGGKIRRNALYEHMQEPSPLGDASNIEYESPQTPVAKFIANLWAEALGIEQVGLQDNFFDLGGDSLKAASFINKIQENWNEIIYVTALFENPTLATFEQYVEKEHPDLTSSILGNAVNLKNNHRKHKLGPSDFVRFRKSIAQASKFEISSPDRANNKAIFILSPPRSGSTLLRVMLAGNNQLFSPPELYLAAYSNLRERKNKLSNSQQFRAEGLIRTIMQLDECSAENAKQIVQQLEAKDLNTQQVYELIQKQIGNKLLIDKTPSYSLLVETLERIESLFDEVLYIHLTRHPYGMVRSFNEAKLGPLWFPHITGKEISSNHLNPYEATELAELVWLSINQNINTFLQKIPNTRKHHIRYEDMVSSPKEEMNKICKFLNIQYDNKMLEPHESKKSRMTDGIYKESRMIGDMKFHQHSGISKVSSELWKSSYQTDFLADETLNLAREFGYSETVASVLNREEFEI